MKTNKSLLLLLILLSYSNLYAQEYEIDGIINNDGRNKIDENGQTVPPYVDILDPEMQGNQTSTNYTILRLKSVRNTNNKVGICENYFLGTGFQSAPCGYVNGGLIFISLVPDQKYLLYKYQTAYSINENRVVVGEAIGDYDATAPISDLTKNRLKAFSWSAATGAIDLGTLGGEKSAAYDINIDNTIVGFADKYYESDFNLKKYARRAFEKKTNSAMTELSIPDQKYSAANAINDAGTIVGNASYGDMGNETSRAFIKLGTQNSSVIDLISLTHPVFKNLVLTSASDINGPGDVFGTLLGSSLGYTFSSYVARPLPSMLKPFPFTGGRETRGTADFQIWRPNTGTWYSLRPKLSGSTISLTDTLVKQWGLPGDMPLFGTDFDGDKIDDLTVWRPSNGTWYTCLSSKAFDCTQGASQQFGLPGDIPVVADFDKDGKSDFVVYRRSLPQAGIVGRWYVKRSSDGVILSQQWGLSEDYPLQGDFNGDGYSDFAVFRASTGTWFALNSKPVNINFPDMLVSKQFGLPGDHPMPRDIDTDGKTDLVVYRPSTGTWFTCLSSKEFECFDSTGFTGAIVQYGLASDIPVLRNVLGGETIPYSVWRPSDSLYKNEGGWYTRIPEATPLLSIKHWGLKSDIPAGVGIRDLLFLTGQENKAR